MVIFNDELVDNVVDSLDIDEITYPFSVLTPDEVALEGIPKVLITMSRGKILRRSLFIRHYLITYESGYSYFMWLVWRKINKVHSYVTGGTYTSFRQYINRIKRLGLIIERPMDPDITSAMCAAIPRDRICGAFDRHYYTIVPGNTLYDIGWFNPQYALYELPKKPKGIRRMEIETTVRAWKILESRVREVKRLVKVTAPPEERERIDEIEIAKKQLIESEIRRRRDEEGRLKRVKRMKPEVMPVHVPVAIPPPTVPPVLVPEGMGSIEGFVTDADTGEPIAGLKVRIAALDIETLTDTMGFYRFANIPVRKYRITYNKDGYRDRARSPIMKPMEKIIVDVSTVKIPEEEIVEIKRRVAVFAPRVEEREALDMLRNMISLRDILKNRISRFEVGENYDIMQQIPETQKDLALITDRFIDLMSSIKKRFGDQTVSIKKIIEGKEVVEAIVRWKAFTDMLTDTTGVDYESLIDEIKVLLDYKTGF